MQVGVRQLRDELRSWLERVRQGEEVIITERGRPVARLIGVSSPAPLDRLIAAGVVTRAKQAKGAARTHRPVSAKGSVSELVAAQRR